jgi:dTDP-4-dehydrorhamnose reductase
MLGGACLRAFGPEAVGRDLDDFDLSERDQTLRGITALQPRLIVNCAAAAEVDRCETDRDYAYRGNILAPKHVAEAAAEVGAKLVHISTVFVFDGAQAAPYRETDLPNPLNYYGSSKLEGERLLSAALPGALIVRTSWMYGLSGIHFPGKLKQWAAKGGPLRIVDDQTGSPTYAEDLAEGLRALTERDASGLVHLGGAGCATRMEYTHAILDLIDLQIEVVPASIDEFPLPAVRPINSCLDCSKAAGLGVGLPPWRDALARYISASKGSW